MPLNIKEVYVCTGGVCHDCINGVSDIVWGASEWSLEILMPSVDRGI